MPLCKQTHKPWYETSGSISSLSKPAEKNETEIHIVVLGELRRLWESGDVKNMKTGECSLPLPQTVVQIPTHSSPALSTNVHSWETNPRVHRSSMISPWRTSERQIRVNLNLLTLTTRNSLSLLFPGLRSGYIVFFVTTDIALGKVMIRRLLEPNF